LSPFALSAYTGVTCGVTANSFYFLSWRDILVRYKQTVVGVAWSAIRPFLTMVILTVVFGKLAKMPSGGVPYPILVFCGMLPWQFFATALT
jgi:homopolymeric O-antigen transport system permease protein